MMSGNTRYPVEKFAHGIDLVVTAVMTTNILQYIRGQCRGAGGSHLSRLAPCYAMLLATILLLLQPVSDFVVDSWTCDGHFSADQLRTGGSESLHSTKLLVCTSHSHGGDLQPKGCIGYYAMDGSFKHVRKTSAVEFAVGDGFPHGCSKCHEMVVFTRKHCGALACVFTAGRYLYWIRYDAYCHSPCNQAAKQDQVILGFILA